MSAVCATKSLNLAAALSACGVVISIDKMTDDPTGSQVLTFYLSPANVENPDDFNPVNSCNEINGPLRFSTAQIKAKIANKSLDAEDPMHPVLDALRVMDNRERLLDWMNRDVRSRLLIHRQCPRFFYREGIEPMIQKLNDPLFETWETSDLKLASSIGLLGVPVLRLEPKEGSVFFVMPRYGYASGPQILDAVALAKRYRSGALAKEQPSHPLLWGIQALKNRDALLSRVKAQQSLILLRNPKSGAWNNFLRSSVIEENASKAAFDDALKHNRRV